jgi:hypothetical protein
MCVILARWGRTNRRITIQASYGIKQNSISKITNTYTHMPKAGQVAHAVERLTHKCETLCSTPSTAKKIFLLSGGGNVEDGAWLEEVSNWGHSLGPVSYPYLFLLQLCSASCAPWYLLLHQTLPTTVVWSLWNNKQNKSSLPEVVSVRYMNSDNKTE